MIYGEKEGLLMFYQNDIVADIMGINKYKNTYPHSIYISL